MLFCSDRHGFLWHERWIYGPVQRNPDNFETASLSHESAFRPHETSESVHRDYIFLKLLSRVVLLGPTDLLIRVDDWSRIFANSINLSKRIQFARIRVDNGHIKKLSYERYLYSRYSKIRNLKLDFDGRSALVSFWKEREKPFVKITRQGVCRLLFSLTSSSSSSSS